VGRVLDLFGIEQALSPAWSGLRAQTPAPAAPD
jgi:3-polyprenyl-4-hydroxybenzoate decarboxylase